MDSNLWGSFKPPPLGLYLSTTAFQESSPKLVIYTIYIYNKLFIAQTNNSEDSCPDLKTLNWQEFFSQGFFNGRYPRPRKFKKVESGGWGAVSMLHQPENNYSDSGNPPDLSTGPDASWYKQEDHAATELCPYQGMCWYWCWSRWILTCPL